VPPVRDSLRHSTRTSVPIDHLSHISPFRSKKQCIERVKYSLANEAGAATSVESDGQRRGVASCGGVAHGGDGAQQWGRYWKERPPAAGAAVSGVGAARRSTRRNPPPRAIMNTFTVPAPAATDARGAVLTLSCPAEQPLPPLGMRARHGVAIPAAPNPQRRPPSSPQKAPHASHLPPSPTPPPTPLSPARGAGRRLWSGTRLFLKMSGRWGLRGGVPVRRWGRQAKAR